MKTFENSRSIRAAISDSPLALAPPKETHFALFEAAPDPMVITDQSGHIVQINFEMERQFGYTREELIGESVERLVPERLRGAHRHHREKYQEFPIYRPMNRGQEIIALRKDGVEVPVEISLAPVRLEEGLLFFGIVRDLSERLAARQTEQHLNFEQALVGLSAKFINLAPDLVDQEIASGLEVLVRALDTDRASLGQFDPLSGDLVVTHEWARPGFPLFGERLVKGVLPWLEKQLLQGQVALMETPPDLPPEAHRERQYVEAMGVKSSLNVPFLVAGKVVGGMSTSAFRNHHRWGDHIVSRVKDVADIFANALARKWNDEELQKALSEVKGLKEKLERENVYLREEIKLDHNHTSVVGNSAGIRTVLKRAEQVAPTPSAALILGETGTGKELIARTIHELSPRSRHPMIKVNCAALPATLIESELFGREKGAYTGALSREVGRFELADKSTIFLDEIGELPLEVQSKLLRVLQEGEFERLGSSRTMHVDVRVIAATSRNLTDMMKEGKFREDLFYRLNVFPILIPPLRQRREDIPALLWHILRELGGKMGRTIERVEASTMTDFQNYSWPGSVRELHNAIERGLILNPGSSTFRAELPDLESTHVSLQKLNEVEAKHFREVLQATNWRIRGRAGAAEVLGLKPTTLEARLKKLGISRANLQIIGGRPPA
jgi:PAS domain S-box-containing protein